MMIVLYILLANLIILRTKGIVCYSHFLFLDGKLKHREVMQLASSLTSVTMKVKFKLRKSDCRACVVGHCNKDKFLPSTAFNVQEAALYNNRRATLH